ncbi:MAG: heme exporter protein CcmB [Planctomycetota bacterium]
MKYSHNAFISILSKDVFVEMRTKQTLPLMVVLAMLIVWILRIICEAASLDAVAVGSAVLLICLLFCGLLVQERSFALEKQDNCISGLLLAPLDVGTIYLAKLAANVIILCIFEIIAVPLILITFHITVADGWLYFLLLLLLVNAAISAVGTLFSAMVQLGDIRTAVLSVLVLTTLMPLMIPAAFVLLVLFGLIPENLGGSAALALAGNLKTATALIIAFDVIYISASWLLFGFVVRE